jgi:formylglycine-generating enzyme
MRRCRTACISLICAVPVLLAGAVFADLGVPVLLEEASECNNSVRIELGWQAEPPHRYHVLTTTNLLSGGWSSTNQQPIQTTNLIGQFAVECSDSARFFKVQRLDTEGPTIVERYPATNGIGVGRSATLTVRVFDETGVDTNSFHLTIDGATTLTNGSPGVTATTNGLQYNPGAKTWGPYAGMVSVQFLCSDTLGNVTTSSWSFTLEVEPVVTDVLVHLPPPPAGASITRAAIIAAAARHNVKYNDGLSMVAFQTNFLIFGYSGASHGLYVGAILVSHDPARVFYRRITDLSEDSQNHQVTAYTIDVPLTDLIREGSLSPEVFVPDESSALAPLWDKNLIYGIPFSYETEFTVLPIEIGTNTVRVRITPAILSCNLQGDVRVSCVISNWQVTAFDTSFSSQFAAELRAQVKFFAAIDIRSETATLVVVPLGYVVGFIGPVPVWVELQLAVDLGLEVGAEGAVSFETGLNAHANTAFRLNWRPESWNSSFDNQFGIVPVPLDVGFQISAEAWLYLKPYLSILLYSLGGVSVDSRRGPSLEASWEVGDPQCEITLYDKWSANVGMTLVGMDDDELPSLKLFEKKRTIRTWYWPKIPEQAPVFTKHPRDVTAAAFTEVYLEACASGYPDPEYQWFQNGQAIPFANQSSLTFRLTSHSVGAYYVTAQNRLGRVHSNTVTVSLIPPSTPTGMALIPAGPFQMGDTFGEGDSDELPVHTVYVSAFYMDRYEVTKAMWDNVMNWASSHGYDIRADSGSGKASDHPVQWVTWYECVKWCNARSEKEGLTPCYTHPTSGDVYRQGECTPDCNWSANGYRLPTEAEWEKAARGGSSGHRFPWADADMITHSRANYCGRPWAYSYDLGYGGYDVNYATCDEPYTSPVGSFTPNGYGLYDMAGNVFEWCWDWYGSNYYGSSVGTDPKGAPSGEYRVLRGGSWYILTPAIHLRCAYRGRLSGPDGSNSFDGFRCVRGL